VERVKRRLLRRLLAVSKELLEVTLKEETMIPHSSVGVHARLQIKESLGKAGQPLHLSSSRA
jgi:hypothetical protein